MGSFGKRMGASEWRILLSHPLYITNRDQKQRFYRSYTSVIFTDAAPITQSALRAIRSILQSILQMARKFDDCGTTGACTTAAHGYEFKLVRRVDSRNRHGGIVHYSKFFFGTWESAEHRVFPVAWLLRW